MSKQKVEEQDAKDATVVMETPPEETDEEFIMSPVVEPPLITESASDLFSDDQDNHR